MENPNEPLRRSRSDPPPPITTEDTATGGAPQPSPSPTQQIPPFSSYEARPAPQHRDSDFRNRKHGHKRKGSPNLEWHDRWTKDSWKQGRVLLIDYVAREHTAAGHRKVVAQEFSNIDELRRFYRNEDLSRQAALRVIHVQNAPWATRFLLHKFNIDASDDLVGTHFGRWARYTQPKVRGNRPVLSGKTFRAQRDPWRGISRAAFGLDYLRHYEKNTVQNGNGASRMKFMELNHFDILDNPAYGFDVYAQRMSVYVQLSDDEPGQPVDPEIRNPYNEEEYAEYQRLKRQYEGDDSNGHDKNYIPKLQTLDNSSTIILFEHSQSGSVKDTLIGARQDVESRWRRLTFYLPPDETSDDDQLAIECMDFIMKDIFKALAMNWEKYINLCEAHVGILEDKIYENPADESRAPELWTNSSLWLKVERLMYIHQDIIIEMRNHLKEVARFDPTPDDPWLAGSVDEVKRLINNHDEGIVKPTTNLSDLMYKSVGIRDARMSNQLGLSMWRLSWITFIFLPLTFVTGFFGMNVDTFESNPSIKWFFIGSVPLLLTVMFSWYGVKHTLASQRQDPLRRGVYESLFHDFSLDYPTLWTRRGPRTNITPIGWWPNIKWKLISRWFDPEHTIASKPRDLGNEEMSNWSRVKRYLARRWLSDIVIIPTQDDTLPTHIDYEEGKILPHELGAVEELLALSAPVAFAADPTAASRMRKRVPISRLRSLSPTGSDGGASSDHGRGSEDARPGSGVMVEEKSEDERSGDESGEGRARRERRRKNNDNKRSTSSASRSRLDVPVRSGGVG